jgi:DNA polymerase III epsilon subunit-like protein
MYLFFDTETTGLPVSWKAPPSDVDNWPRVVQLAWAAFDVRGRKAGARSYVIRPDGFKIPKTAERIHGISTTKAKRTGVPVAEALGMFAKALSKASVVVAHNLSFDANVVDAEFHRLGMQHQFQRKTHVCTKEAGQNSVRYLGGMGTSGRRYPNSI